MRHPLRLAALTAVAALAVLPVTIAAPASAAPAAHDVYVENYDATESFGPGDAEPCVPWAGTFREVRTGEVNLVTVSTGPHSGEVHLTGIIDGFIEYTPREASQPTYSGPYREKLNGYLHEFSFDSASERISQFRLRGTLSGTDGTSLTIVMSAQLTINANGALTVDRSDFTCE